MKWEESLSRILVGGFGPEVVKGMISKYLELIPPDKCQEYIQSSHSLLEPISESQWQLIRKAARAGGIRISYTEVIGQLEKNRPDLLGIISCTDGGVAWLRRQVEDAQKRLAS